MCAIGLEKIERVVANANQYQRADFKIWVDSKLLDDSTRFWLGSFVHNASKAKNIEICDLQSIPDYAEDPLFYGQHVNKRSDREGWGNIYSRADYARIIMLDHCVETEKSRSRIFYSDTDCQDIRLPEAMRIVDDFGIAIHGTGNLTLSHGYIGLSNRDNEIKSGLKSLKADARVSAHAGQLGCNAFGVFLERLGLPHKTWMPLIGLKGLLPEIGYEMSANPVLKQLGIN